MPTVPDSALALTRQFEGCGLTAYSDLAGNWTIGYGHCGSDVTSGLVWSEEQAESALLEDAQAACDAVSKLVRVPLTENQLAALTDFVFNLGYGSLRASTLLVCLNGQEYDAVPAELMRWTHVNGREIPGLVRRRQAEVDLWNSIPAANDQSPEVIAE